MSDTRSNYGDTQFVIANPRALLWQNENKTLDNSFQSIKFPPFSFHILDITQKLTREISKCTKIIPDLNNNSINTCLFTTKTELLCLVRFYLRNSTHVYFLNFDGNAFQLESHFQYYVDLGGRLVFVCAYVLTMKVVQAGIERRFTKFIFFERMCVLKVLLIIGNV